MLFCVTCVFCRLVVLVRLSVPVQVIDWKNSSPKCVVGDVKPYSLTHLLSGFRKIIQSYKIGFENSVRSTAFKNLLC